MGERVEPLAVQAIEDGAFVAVHPLKAARLYPPGTRVVLVPWVDRSEVSHRHEFAWLKEAWQQLPETLAEQCPTPEHLRKRALIETGFYYETLVDAGSQAAALRVAAFMRGVDDLALVVTRGPLVVRRVAKSQARGAMTPAEFQASKQAILEWVSAAIGCTPETLRHQAGRAA